MITPDLAIDVDFDGLFTSLAPGDFTFALIKPDAFTGHVETEICDLILSSGLQIMAHRDAILDADDVRALYYEHVGKFFYDRNAQFIMSGPCRLMILTGHGAQRLWREILMPRIRERWGQHNDDPEKKHLNLVHGSDNWNNAFREVQYFFA